MKWWEADCLKSDRNLSHQCSVLVSVLATDLLQALNPWALFFSFWWLFLPLNCRSLKVYNGCLFYQYYNF